MNKNGLIKRNFFMAAAALSALIAPSAFAITGTEIAQNVHDRDNGDSVHALIQMDLVDKNGGINSRVVETWGMEDEKDLDMMVMMFHQPASVANTRFLVVENEGRDDDKWIYLPALKKVRRIDSSEGSNSFMGTDLSYDDMETRKVEEDTHELLKEEKIGGYECYVVKAVSIDPSNSQYSQRISWIDKNTWIPVKMELYDKKGNLEKVMTAEKIEKVQNYWSILQTTMKNVQTGHSTVLAIKKLVYDEKLNRALFTTQFLSAGRI